jgi:hypothetical protein
MSRRKSVKKLRISGGANCKCNCCKCSCNKCKRPKRKNSKKSKKGGMIRAGSVQKLRLGANSK